MIPVFLRISNILEKRNNLFGTRYDQSLNNEISLNFQNSELEKFVIFHDLLTPQGF